MNITDYAFAAAVWLLVVALLLGLLWKERSRVSSHMPHFSAAWRWTHGKRLAILAGIFSAGEAVVMSGIELPGAKDIPVLWRLLGIAVIVGMAFYLRWRANRESKRVS
jgi:hypothetical protein